MNFYQIGRLNCTATGDGYCDNYEVFINDEFINFLIHLLYSVSLKILGFIVVLWLIKTLLVFVHNSFN